MRSAICQQQGQRLIEELILLAHKQLQGGQSADEVFSRLFAKQRKVICQATQGGACLIFRAVGDRRLQITTVE
jgi:hypothetical protein